MIGLIVFLVFAISGYYKYIRSSRSNVITKILHLTIMFMLFMSFFGNFKILLWNIFEEGFNSLIVINDNLYPVKLDVYGNVYVFLLSFYASGLVLKVTAQGTSRNLFLISLPFLALAYSIDMHKTIISNYSSDVDILTLFLYVLLITFTIMGIIYLFYCSKQAKLLFSKKESDD